MRNPMVPEFDNSTPWATRVQWKIEIPGRRGNSGYGPKNARLPENHYPPLRNQGGYGENPQCAVFVAIDGDCNSGAHRSTSLAWGLNPGNYPTRCRREGVGEVGVTGKRLNSVKLFCQIRKLHYGIRPIRETMRSVGESAVRISPSGCPCRVSA